MNINPWSVTCRIMTRQYTYVLESVCELLQASFLKWTIENKENTVSLKKIHQTLKNVSKYNIMELNIKSSKKVSVYLRLPPLSLDWLSISSKSTLWLVCAWIESSLKVKLPYMLNKKQKKKNIPMFWEIIFETDFKV